MGSVSCSASGALFKSTSPPAGVFLLQDFPEGGDGECPALLPVGFVGIQPLWGGFRDVNIPCLTSHDIKYPMRGVFWDSGMCLFHIPWEGFVGMPPPAPLQALLVSSHPVCVQNSCWNLIPCGSRGCVCDPPGYPIPNPTCLDDGLCSWNQPALVIPGERAKIQPVCPSRGSWD